VASGDIKRNVVSLCVVKGPRRYTLEFDFELGPTIRSPPDLRGDSDWDYHGETWFEASISKVMVSAEHWHRNINISIERCHNLFGDLSKEIDEKILQMLSK
jgi:hypothetical protein